jgi:hypothetical protein
VCFLLLLLKAGRKSLRAKLGKPNGCAALDKRNQMHVGLLDPLVAAKCRGHKQTNKIKGKEKPCVSNSR